jgi:hypothetical protein
MSQSTIESNQQPIKNAKKNQHTCGSTNVTQKIDPQAVSSPSPLIEGALLAGLGVLSGVPLTLTSGTTPVMVIDLALVLPAPDFSELTEVLGWSEEDIDCFEEGYAGPKVAPESGKEGGELGSGDRLPGFGRAMITRNGDLELRSGGNCNEATRLCQRVLVCVCAFPHQWFCDDNEGSKN